MNVTSYLLLTSILEYQTWVLRDNFEEANAILNSGAIPDSENNKISRFLESQGFREEALEVANDPEQRFSLALQVSLLMKIFHIIILRCILLTAVFLIFLFDFTLPLPFQ